MADDIRAGDVVVCVDARVHSDSCVPSDVTILRNGRMYRVERSGHADQPVVWLKSPQTSVGYRASRFRKIDAPKTEISERIRACRPIKVGEDA